MQLWNLKWELLCRTEHIKLKMQAPRLFLTTFPLFHPFQTVPTHSFSFSYLPLSLTFIYTKLSLKATIFHLFSFIFFFLSSSATMISNA